MIRLQVSQSMKQNIQHHARELMSDNDVRICLLDNEEKVIEQVTLVLSCHDSALLGFSHIGETGWPVTQQRSNGCVHGTWLLLDRCRIINVHWINDVSAM